MTFPLPFPFTETPTNEQQIVSEKLKTKYENLFLNTTEIDKNKAEKSIRVIYKLNKNKYPKFYWVDSPLMALAKMNELLGTDKQYYHPTSYGNDGWLYLLEYSKEALKINIDDNKISDAWIETTNHCHWWYGYHTFCVCVRRPKQVKITKNRVRVTYHDGWHSNTPNSF